MKFCSINVHSSLDNQNPEGCANASISWPMLVLIFPLPFPTHRGSSLSLEYFIRHTGIDRKCALTFFGPRLPKKKKDGERVGLASYSLLSTFFCEAGK